MPKIEHPLEQLRSYLPENSFDKVVYFLHHYKVHLTITAQRQSVLGDYRNAVQGKNHRISINGNLNKFSFLITLIHELAHLVAFETYGNKILAHGKEWKFIYSNLLKEFITIKIFPDDIETALHHSVKNPAASSCAEEGLMRVLRLYDKNKEDILLLEEIPQGAYFVTIEGRIFKKGSKLRKRFRCTEKNTDRVYLISGLYEVKLVV
jgi:hypothetical protein